MKNPDNATRKMEIAFLTQSPLDASLAQKTLSHVYPGTKVREFSKQEEFLTAKANVYMIEAQSVREDRLETLLDEMPDAPVILLVPDFQSSRPYGRFLTARRTIVTQADISGMGIVQALHHLVERQTLREQLQLASRHLKELSVRDDLTRLFNHRHFCELLDAEVRKCNRYKRPLSLVIAGIRNFSSLIASQGATEVDKSLSRTANAIKNVVRDADIAGRFGDSEFAIILPESGEEGATVAARRIQEGLAMDDKTGLQMVFGIATLAEGIRTKEDIVRIAMSALGEAKKAGAGSICTSSDVDAKRGDLRENRQLIEQLNERFARLSTDAERGYFQSLIKAIGEIPVLKKNMVQHSERVAFFAQRMGEQMGLSEKQQHALHRAGFLHDTGKLAINPEVITKAGRLTPAERQLIEKHPTFGIQIIGHPSFFTMETEGILHHHERFDGNGYPDGLSGDAIPLAARIISVAEAWDTMTTPQAYRQTPLGLDVALSQLKDGAGAQFDPDVVERFVNLITG